MLRMKALCAVVPMVIAASAMAQPLNKGDTVAGASVGFGWGGVTFGGAFEMGLIDDIAPNISLSAGVMGTYTNYTTGWNSWNVSHTFIGGMANLNYHTPELGALQPYGGVILGYNIINVSGAYGGSLGSGATGGAQVGARYYFTDTLALNARLGYPVVSIGVDYRF